MINLFLGKRNYWYI